MKLAFLRIETRGGNLVAVFDRGYRAPMFDFGLGGPTRYDDGTFCLDEANLRTRIRNVEAGLANPNRDASVERFALAQLERTKDAKDVAGVSGANK